MLRKNKLYEELKQQSIEHQTLHSILSLLHWDQETYMPSGAIQSRSSQIAYLSTLLHEKKTGRRYKIALEKLVSLSTGKIKIRGLSKEKRVALREWHREFVHLTRLPSSFIQEFSELTSQAGPVWASAKKENQFKLFAPFLEKIVALSRKKAALLGFEEHPYDALLKAYEPCMTTKKVGEIFSSLEKELVSLLKKIVASKKIDKRCMERKISEKTQVELAHKLLSYLPMEPEYSRLDLSNHPFSTSFHPRDSRITTRVLPNDFLSNLLSTLHEAGHSMYEMGLPIKHWGTPLAEAISLSIHESQSRWWETLIGRSLPFWKGFYPLIQSYIPHLKKVPLQKFYRASQAVAPSFIRVEADEVTYCLHVILRFEIEKALISDELKVADLPDAWNAKMKELLGIVPPNYSQGCLQDIHWALGDFGYFPTYALGNLIAAQFFSTFAKKHPDWEKRVEKKESQFIRKWQKEEIHSWGKTYNSEDLVKKVTGKPLSEKAYTNYLKSKYTEIYHLD